MATDRCLNDAKVGKSHTSTSRTPIPSPFLIHTREFSLSSSSRTLIKALPVCDLFPRQIQPIPDIYANTYRSLSPFLRKVHSMPISQFPNNEEIQRVTRLDQLVRRVEERARDVGLAEKIILDWAENRKRTFLLDSGRLPSSYLKDRKSWETLETTLNTFVSKLRTDYTLVNRANLYALCYTTDRYISPGSRPSNHVSGFQEDLYCRRIGRRNRNRAPQSVLSLPLYFGQRALST